MPPIKEEFVVVVHSATACLLTHALDLRTDGTSSGSWVCDPVLLQATAQCSTPQTSASQLELVFRAPDRDLALTQNMLHPIPPAARGSQGKAAACGMLRLRYVLCRHLCTFVYEYYTLSGVSYPGPVAHELQDTSSCCSTPLCADCSGQ
jgi:hypothetical protein